MLHSLQTLVTQSPLRLAHRLRSPVNGDTRHSPCLILLHGVGANETNLIEMAQQQDPRLTVILARGPIGFGPNAFGWFNVNFTAAGPVIQAEQAEHSRQLLVDFIGGLPATYGIDPARIWIAGFSQGGIMSAGVGLTRPDKVAGFGVLSGRILPEIGPLMASAQALASMQAFVSHGIDDNKLPLQFAHASRQLLTDRHVALTYREYPAGHELNAAMLHDFGQWMLQRLAA